MQDPRSFGIVTIADTHAILQPVVIASLGREGFVDVGSLKWVRSADAPIRQLFCFFRWKGGMLASSWGLSLDFVPHVARSRLKWHRTPKSAIMDLRVDSRDRALDIPYSRGPQLIRERAQEVVRGAMVHAISFWDEYRTPDRLLDAFKWLKQYYATPGLGFANFVQHPLALAFVYARAGDLVQAYRELEDYGPSLDVDVKEELHRRLADTVRAA
jgi:hypothetical protein